MDRVADLRADYEALGALLRSETDGSRAASLARERRLLGELLESLDAPEVMTVVDQLASRRRSTAKAAGAAKRRGKSG